MSDGASCRTCWPSRFVTLSSSACAAPAGASLVFLVCSSAQTDEPGAISNETTQARRTFGDGPWRMRCGVTRTPAAEDAAGCLRRLARPAARFARDRVRQRFQRRVDVGAEVHAQRAPAAALQHLQVAERLRDAQGG